MNDNKIYTLGLIPYITQADLDKLTDEGQEVIRRELGKTQGTMAFQEDLTPEQIRDLMEALGVTPIWGREGLVVYRLSIEGKVLTFGVAPDPGKDLIHPSILERQFITCDSITDLVERMSTVVQSAAKLEQSLEILPEDHPEESAIGFICPQLNTVWLLNTDVVGQNLEAGEVGPWAQVGHLIQSNQGRLALALMVAQNRLQTHQQFLEQTASLNALTPQPMQVTKRQQEEIVINLISGKISDRYKDRYMGKKEGQ